MVDSWILCYFYWTLVDVSEWKAKYQPSRIKLQHYWNASNKIKTFDHLKMCLYIPNKVVLGKMFGCYIKERGREWISVSRPELLPQMKKKTEKGTKRIKGAGNKRKLVLSSSVLASWVWSYTSKETTSEVRSEILLFDKII